MACSFQDCQTAQAQTQNICWLFARTAEQDFGETGRRHALVYHKTESLLLRGNWLRVKIVRNRNSAMLSVLLNRSRLDPNTHDAQSPSYKKERPNDPRKWKEPATFEASTPHEWASASTYGSTKPVNNHMVGNFQPLPKLWSHPMHRNVDLRKPTTHLSHNYITLI